MPVRDKELYKKIEGFVDEFQAEYYRSPSMREIAAGVGSSYPTVCRAMQDMRDRHVLDYSGQRNIATKRADAKNNSSVIIPLVGKIACGAPKEAFEDVRAQYAFPPELFGSAEMFILEADGDSMLDKGIHKGDLVVCRRQNTAQPGDIVAALIANETATLKTYHPKKNGIVKLSPANDAYYDIVVNTKKQALEIQGVAISVIHNF